MKQNLLVLDIDETLLHAAESPLLRQADFQLNKYSVYLRPHVREFLESVFDWFEVAIWTSSGSSYAACMVDRVIPNPERLKFVWASDRCTRRFDSESQQQYWIKDFKKLKRTGYQLRNVLVIDDSPEKHCRNYGNLIRVFPFTGDPADRELQDLMPYLHSIRNHYDFRSFEKRNWRIIARRLQEQHAQEDNKREGI